MLAVAGGILIAAFVLMFLPEIIRGAAFVVLGLIATLAVMAFWPDVGFWLVGGVLLYAGVKGLAWCSDKLAEK